MNNTTTNKAVSLKEQGYSDRYILTPEGQIIDSALDQPLKPCGVQQYRLQASEGKTVIRALKPLYRAIYGKEYAEDSIEDIEGEEWKMIDNGGKYYVSSMGRIKSYQGKRARLLKPYTNQRGYYRVDIKLDTRRTYLVHQLVALAFIPNDEKILQTIQTATRQIIKCQIFVGYLEEIM